MRMVFQASGYQFPSNPQELDDLGHALVLRNIYVRGVRVRVSRWNSLVLSNLLLFLLATPIHRLSENCEE